MRRTALILSMFATLAPLAGAEDTAAAAYAPRLAVATPLGATLTTVAWAPGDVAADSYRVYGWDSAGVAFLLLDTATSPTPSTLAASVPAGFPVYGVSGVHDGTESVRVRALNPPCILVETEPNPGVSLGCV